MSSAAGPDMLPPAPPPGGVSEFTRDGKELLMAFGALIIGWIVFNVVNGPVGQVFDKAASALNWMLSNPFGWIVGIFVFLLFKSEWFREKFFGFWGDTFKGVKRRIFSERNWFNSRSYEQNQEDLDERTVGAKNKAEARDLHEQQNEEWEKTLKAEGSGANARDVDTLEEFRKNYETQAMPADNKNYKDGQTNADVLDQRDGLKPHERMKSVAERNIKTLEDADSGTYASEIEYWKGVSKNCDAVDDVLKKSANESFVKSFGDVIEATRIDATASHFEIIKASMKKIERRVKSGNYATSEEAFNDLRLNLPAEFADMQKAGVLGEADKVLPSFTKNGREVTGFKPSGMDPLRFNGEPLSATAGGEDIFSIVEKNMKDPGLKPPLTGLSTTHPDLWKDVSGKGLPIADKLTEDYPPDSLAAVEAERSKTLHLEGAVERAEGAGEDVAAVGEEVLEER